MPDIPFIRLADYDYELPEDRIAKVPLSQRDQSRLLVYRKGAISHRHFYELPQELPEEPLLVFNDTRVIPARIIMHRESGARIEILLLKPVSPREVHKAMLARGHSSWECMIGNKKKWKDQETLRLSLEVEGQPVSLYAQLIDRERQWVEFHWESEEELTFAELVKAVGNLPLPPYLKRDATERDKLQYQTVYARAEGAVAAPTAGLHFTDSVLEELKARNVGQEYVTLHVGAGTFQPVKSENAASHAMHGEQIIIRRSNLQRLLAHWPGIIAVGTTSLRVLESLYWLGVEMRQRPEAFSLNAPWQLDQHVAYRYPQEELPSPPEALQSLLVYMEQHKLEQVTAETEIYIYPGYEFKMIQGLITNFHLPKTTLILLVAALIGEDWRKVYESALSEDYRFLSYGDSSLLMRGGDDLRI
jgi:S-adenosylmethionine:tRNA ribosyltransferase-isomerase